MNKVHIPSSVKEIGTGAFRFCSTLEELIIPESVEYISSDAFSECRCLRKLYLPSSLKTIGGNALYRVPRSAVQYTGVLDLEEAFDAIEVTKKREQIEREKKVSEERRFNNRCQYCGGVFKGLFTKTCSKCGKEKDY